MVSNQKIPKKCQKFLCETCDYTTFNKKDFKKHIQTIKHNTNKNQPFLTEKSPKIPTSYDCICGKKYKDKSGLWRHRKKCINISVKQEENQIEQAKLKENQIEKIQIKENTEINISNSDIVELIKQNQEFKELLIEQNKTILQLSSKTTIINYNSKTTNKFNLNIFLNESCKDALNINEFINSIELKLKDLETVGKLGYVEGISKIIVKGLKELDVYKRPMHCSDLKREIIYVKDENEWKKEDEEKNKIKYAIKEIANKNIKQIPEWIKENPDCTDFSSKKNDEYMCLLSNAMIGNSIEEQCNYLNQIIKNVSKEVYIEKN